MRIPVLLAVLALPGCATMDTSGVVTATPAPFPHPGMYSGEAINGIATYQINEDGTGLSCFRNKLSGKMFFGDLKYDGEKIHTQDGTVNVESVTEDAVNVSALFLSMEMHRIDTTPTTCREFFASAD